jgi:hypothetical protein
MVGSERRSVPILIINQGKIQCSNNFPLNFSFFNLFSQTLPKSLMYNHIGVLTPTFNVRFTSSLWTAVL